MSVRLLPVIAIVLLATAPRAEDAHDHAPEHDEHETNGTEAVRLDGNELREFGIEVADVSGGTIERWVALPGEVRPNADRLAHIVPRFSGIVADVRANIGDRVERGRVLAIVESDESLAPFEVTTRIAGTVIEKHISLGEAVSRDRDTFVIADLSTVWVDLTVYPRDLDRIRVGQPVRLLVGHVPSPDTGHVGYVTPVVDEVTRTATARMVLPNPDGAWRPGMFVTGRVLVDRTEVPVAVPATALHTHEGARVIFVAEDDGFVPREVELGLRGGDLVEIVRGLAPGERYVRSGGFTLKAELEKESLGHGHSH